jgi:hypothetical protein
VITKTTSRTYTRPAGSNGATLADLPGTAGSDPIVKDFANVPFPKPLALNPLSSLPILLEVVEVVVQHHPLIPLPISLELVNLEKPPNLYLIRIILNLCHRSRLPTISRMLLPLLQEELQDHRHLSWSKLILETLLVLLLVLLVLQPALRLPTWPFQLQLARWVDYGGNLTYPLRLDPILPRESIQQDCRIPSSTDRIVLLNLQTLPMLPNHLLPRSSVISLRLVSLLLLVLRPLHPPMFLVVHLLALPALLVHLLLRIWRISPVVLLPFKLSLVKLVRSLALLPSTTYPINLSTKPIILNRLDLVEVEVYFRS